MRKAYEMKKYLLIGGLAATGLGALLGALGGLFALFVFVSGDGTTSRGVVGALGLYFLGKSLAVAGLGVLHFASAMPLPTDSTK